VHATNLVSVRVFNVVFMQQVHCAESVLRLISDLKQSLLVYNALGINRNAEADTQRYEDEQKRQHHALLQLQSEVDAALHELETEYYSSSYR